MRQCRNLQISRIIAKPNYLRFPNCTPSFFLSCRHRVQPHTIQQPRRFCIDRTQTPPHIDFRHTAHTGMKQVCKHCIHILAVRDKGRIILPFWPHTAVSESCAGHRPWLRPLRLCLILGIEKQPSQRGLLMLLVILRFVRAQA